MVKKLILVMMLVCTSANADPSMHKFEYWGDITSFLDKATFYVGWTNGFLPGKGQRGLELSKCLDKLSYAQVVAMIDKRYKDHPEKWSSPIGLEILEALTFKGSSCEGKNPLTDSDQ